jgi:hypothetical protein
MGPAGSGPLPFRTVDCERPPQPWRCDRERPRMHAAPSPASSFSSSDVGAQALDGVRGHSGPIVRPLGVADMSFCCALTGAAKRGWPHGPGRTGRAAVLSATVRTALDLTSRAWRRGCVSAAETMAAARARARHSTSRGVAPRRHTMGWRATYNAHVARSAAACGAMRGAPYRRSIAPLVRAQAANNILLSCSIASYPRFLRQLAARRWRRCSPRAAAAASR